MYKIIENIEEEGHPVIQGKTYVWKSNKLICTGALLAPFPLHIGILTFSASYTVWS